MVSEQGSTTTGPDLSLAFSYKLSRYVLANVPLGAMCSWCTN